MAAASVSQSIAIAPVFRAQLQRRFPLTSPAHPCLTRIRINAVQAPEECNEADCAPEKEVGKLSLEWKAEENTKVTGTFPPIANRDKRWVGYVEKDTAGQTNIYSVEPPVYVAESAFSSGNAGPSAEGSDNNLAVAFLLGFLAVAGASTILLQVAKNPPPNVEEEYAGPPLSYYIKKFSPEPQVAAPVLDIVPVTEETSPTEDASSLEETSSTSPTQDASSLEETSSVIS